MLLSTRYYNKKIKVFRLGTYQPRGLNAEFQFISFEVRTRVHNATFKF